MHIITNQWGDDMYTAACNITRRNITCTNAKGKKVRSKRLKRKILKLFLFLLLLLFAFLLFCSVKIIFKLNQGNEYMVNGSSEYLQLQNPQLPNGCEATSLAMALTISGTPCDKFTAYEAVPASDFVTLDDGTVAGSDPELMYAGNAASESGFYCFTKPITEAANLILQQNAAEKTARDLSGATLSELDTYLKNNIPVIIWVTKGFESPTLCKNFSWIISDSGEKYFPYSNLHCVLLNSVKSNVYEILDPLSGVIKVDKDLLNKIYVEMGSRAVVIS